MNVIHAYSQRETSRRQKCTALKGDMQGRGGFFADWQSAENEEATPR